MFCLVCHKVSLSKIVCDSCSSLFVDLFRCSRCGYRSFLKHQVHDCDDACSIDSRIFARYRFTSELDVFLKRSAWSSLAVSQWISLEFIKFLSNINVDEVAPIPGSRHHLNELVADEVARSLSLPFSYRLKSSGQLWVGVMMNLIARKKLISHRGCVLWVLSEHHLDQ